eukprot:Phypoly_transcript_03370.p2 GENE.Phypoly_transcript_03370~~Phypoly_transcript_03370.p2  ORF type:complete len:351 (-),score=51.22 Phypoly_transcript_03370:220-1272(-)
MSSEDEVEERASAAPAYSSGINVNGLGAPNQFSIAPPREPQNVRPTLDQVLEHFWISSANEITSHEDFKTHAIPLARIKKIMKFDDEVKMISAEAPALFSKACELFVLEIAHRAWHHTGSSRRRTIQKSDIAIAISKSDMFDFLIDIVPREEIKPMTKKAVEEANGNLEYRHLFYHHHQSSQFGQVNNEEDEDGELHNTDTGANNSQPLHNSNFYNYSSANHNTTILSPSTHTLAPPTNNRHASQQLYTHNTPYQHTQIQATNSEEQPLEPPDPIPYTTPIQFVSNSQHPTPHPFSSTNPLSIDTLLRHSGEHTISQDDPGAFVGPTPLSTTSHSTNTSFPGSNLSDSHT